MALRHLPPCNATVVPSSDESSGAAGLRARPELHLGATQQVAGASARRHADADHHPAAATRNQPDNRHDLAAAAFPTARPTALTAAREPRPDDATTTRTGAVPRSPTGLICLAEPRRYTGVP